MTVGSGFLSFTFPSHPQMLPAGNMAVFYFYDRRGVILIQIM